MADEKKITPEEMAARDKAKAAKKVVKNAKKAAKNSAFEVLKQLVDKSNDKNAVAALTTIRPSLYGAVSTPNGGNGSSSAASKFIALVTEKKTISEDDVFKALKIGRKDAAQSIRKFLKKAAPADRVWINFDKDKGVYTVVGTGATAPASYTGSVPTVEAVTLK